MMAVASGDIHRAAEHLSGHVVETPMLHSDALDAIAGRRVLVKAEALQKTGSFKYRGARAALSVLEQDALNRGVLAFSSGNHAQGVACAARELGVHAVIVMPSDAPRLKRDNTTGYGAEVILYDRLAEDREAIAENLVASRGLALIKPFDDPNVIAGQGTCGLEIADQARRFGIEEADVLVPCGGGGLSAGIALALEAEAPGLRVRPVEPTGFDDTTRSLAMGTRVANKATAGSIQDALLSPMPGELTFPVLRRLAGPGFIISDDDAMRAIALALIRLKIVLEPGGAAALAAALLQPESIRGNDVIVVASGGNTDPEMLASAAQRFRG